MSDEPETSVEGARLAAERGELARWVGAFLRSPGSDNADLADQLEAEPRHWIGPVRLRFVELARLAGPPGSPALERFDDDDVETVDDMQESLEDGWSPAPLVVSSRGDLDGGQLVVEDGNHRIEGLRRAGRHGYWAVVCFDDVDDRDRFLAGRPR